MGALPDVAAKRLSVFVGEVVGCRRCCRGAKFGRGVMTTSWPEWRNGRRRGLKIPRGQPRESSTLSSGIAMLFVFALVQVITPPSMSGAVRGAESGEPLGFSIVTLVPGARRRFTDAAGAFQLDSLAVGTYVLSVRQIGYAPLDTQIVVRDGRPAVVQIALRHLAIELPPVTVAAGRCTTPGPPASSDTALRAVFDQLEENARRFELLADSYPFRYTLVLSVREVSLRGDTTPTGQKRIELTSR